MRNISYKGIQKTREDYSHKLMIEVKCRENVIPVEVGGGIVSIMQRGDFHGMTVEQHQIRAAQIIEELLGLEKRELWKGEKAVIDGPGEKNSFIKEGIGHRLYDLASEIGRNLSENEKDILWLWARTHDEGKFRESEIHLPRRIIYEDRLVPVKADKKDGSERLLNFHNIFGIINKEHDEIVFSLWEEWKDKLYIEDAVYSRLREIHKEYMNFTKSYKKGEKSSQIPSRLACLCAIADELAKAAPVGRAFPDSLENIERIQKLEILRDSIPRQYYER